jgi:iron complex outermembrane recepter protein
MKRILLTTLLSTSTFLVIAQENDSTRYAELQSVGIRAVKAASDAPFTKINISKQQLKSMNTSQDLPMLLQYQVGVQSFSDAGNGVGYTGLRIRGSDITRINVTLNGVPVNDAEGQGAFFVNLPDVASSANSIQIQRGAGGSTNGPGAFGASIHINTLPEFSKKKLSISTDFGSLQTGKITIMGNSNFESKKLASSFRLSALSSEGYIRNAFSRLFGGQYNLTYNHNKTTSIAFNYLGGKEKTGLAWDGVPDYIVDTNRKFNGLGIKEDGTFYRNQTDNYQQHYFQVFLNKMLGTWKLNLTPYYTRGLGYYQEYKLDQDFADYQITPFIKGSDTLSKGSIIRQLWLNNHLFGAYANAIKSFRNASVTFSLHANQYQGKHYGTTPFVQFAPAIINTRWYNLTSNKKDKSAFIKYNYKPSKEWNLYADLQYRNITYQINGFRKNPTLQKDLSWNFLNPKAGISYNIKNTNKQVTQLYASYAIARKEPNREDLENGATIPKSERLSNTEIGFSARNSKWQIATNAYTMLYKDQLVLTGKVNDVGAYTRTNVAKSYRIGLEAEATFKVNKQLSIQGNAAWSENRIQSFTEYLWDWDQNQEIATHYKNTKIAYSPSFIAAYGATYTFAQKLKRTAQVMYLGKWVSNQYLDNTASLARSLPSYHNADLLLNFNPFQFSNKTNIRFGLYNLFNELYQSNGYAFSDISQGIRNNYINVYPQAGKRFMIGATWNFE